MNLFNKIGSVTKSVVDRTSNGLATARLNSKISALRSGIDAQKQRIGDFYWLRHHEDGSFDPALSDEFKRIEEYLVQIASFEKAIKQILENEKLAVSDETEKTEIAERITAGNGAVCPVCGGAKVSGAKFCVTCGVAFTAAPETITCGDCGAKMIAHAKFCSVCGAKNAEDGPEAD